MKIKLAHSFLILLVLDAQKIPPKLAGIFLGTHGGEERAVLELFYRGSTGQAFVELKEIYFSE